MTPQQPHDSRYPQGWTQEHIWQQQTILNPTILTASSQDGPGALSLPDEPMTQPSSDTKKRARLRLVAIAIALALALALYFVWHTSPSPSTASSAVITQQNFGSPSSLKNSNGGTSANTSGSIQVYVVGAVKHPGVYLLPADARVYQLLQAAGGPLPKANLVALNLAARLSDGQEVYVTMIGEAPPSYVGGVPGTGGNTTGQTGQLVNINTASADELRQNLHISSTTAQAIVNFRLQHGSFTSVDQLSQVVSKSIYDKIKGLVTV